MRFYHTEFGLGQVAEFVTGSIDLKTISFLQRVCLVMLLFLPLLFVEVSALPRWTRLPSMTVYVSAEPVQNFGKLSWAVRFKRRRFEGGSSLTLVEDLSWSQKACVANYNSHFCYNKINRSLWRHLGMPFAICGITLVVNNKSERFDLFPNLVVSNGDKRKTEARKMTLFNRHLTLSCHARWLVVLFWGPCKRPPHRFGQSPAINRVHSTTMS